MKCFLEHDYVIEVLFEAVWYDCMFMRCKKYDHDKWCNVMYMRMHAKQWTDACLIEMRNYEMRTN